MAKSNLRSEIQALKNQAKARGHADIVADETLKEKAFTTNAASQPSYAYVGHDLVRTFFFLILALLLLFILSMMLSTLPQFAALRTLFHIKPFSL